MTIKEQLELVRAGLEEWAKKQGGKAVIARDPVHLFALLAHKPGAVIVSVFFREERKWGESDESGMVERIYNVILSRGRAFTLDQADTLVKGAAGGAALFDLIEEARDLVRGLEFTASEDHPAYSAEIAPNYLGTRLLEYQGTSVIDAYQVEFSILTQLPATAA